MEQRHNQAWADEKRRSTMLLDAQETVSLIGSDRVQGTAVFGPDGQKIGSIERVMIKKFSGKVSYAVLSFGGFFGIGDDYYPLPWPSLKYNVELGGYQTMITRDQLRKAPRYARSSDWNWNDQQLARSVSAYYGVPIP
jgi:PRC-barrel domain protein